MKLPSFKRLIKSDFPKEYQQLVELLANSINIAFDSLFNLTNGNISLKDNIYCQVKEIDVVVDSKGIPIKTTSFISELTTKPEGLIVIQYTNLTNSTTYATSGITIAFTPSNKSIVINHITGLPANNTFRLKVVLFG